MSSLLEIWLASRDAERRALTPERFAAIYSA
jgi:hypothetical protein